jgi:hypothetical protein
MKTVPLAMISNALWCAPDTGTNTSQQRVKLHDSNYSATPGDAM